MPAVVLAQKRHADGAAGHLGDSSVDHVAQSGVFLLSTICCMQIAETFYEEQI